MSHPMTHDPARPGAAARGSDTSGIPKKGGGGRGRTAEGGPAAEDSAGSNTASSITPKHSIAASSSGGCGSCGCSTLPCGCCDGVQASTPASISNRPGLPALQYRVGTHSQFLRSMKARLSTMEVDGVDAEGRELSALRPLKGLTTRDPSDPSIALLDAWAMVVDVMSFYQERIANEAYLRTATERRSVLELARLVGYTLRPGVAATAYLAYTLDDNQKDPVTIAAGAASKSVPAPDEEAQTFETAEDLDAQREWNNLQVRLQRPQNITLANALSITTLQAAGVNTNLKTGDKLLFLFSADGASAVTRSVASIEAQFADQRTAITLQKLPVGLAEATTQLADFLEKTEPLVNMSVSSGEQRALKRGRELLNQTYLGVLSQPLLWVASMRHHADVPLPAAFDTVLNDLLLRIVTLLEELTGTSTPTVTSPSVFVQQLLKPRAVQFRNSLQLPRSLAQAFLPASATATAALAMTSVGGTTTGTATATTTTAAAATATINPLIQAYPDVGTQLLVNFVPHLAPAYYTAWAGANLNPAQSPLLGVHVLRARAAPFGATASRLPRYSVANDANMPAGTPAGTLMPPNLWSDWLYDADEATDKVYLDQPNEAIAPGSYALVDVAGSRRVLRVAEVAATPRSAYQLSGPSTLLRFDAPTNGVWRDVGNEFGPFPITPMRKTQLHLQSEPLLLLDEPITDPVSGQLVELDGLYSDLKSGRWVIFSGERADIEDVDGVRSSELLMIAAVTQGFNATLPGDTIHTTLTLATAPAYSYKRATLTIYGNVVKATHGETRHEVLGSGDGAQSLQSFTLKQPPLTFVVAPTAAGAQSTLHAYINDVEWHETDSLAWLGAKDRGFATLTDDDSKTTLTFGNGVHGARLPTGVENVTAVYRNGIGQGGNVRPEQIGLLQTRPLGVKAVINPLRASGGADKESRDLARDNAPLSVMPLDRLVSVRDYADFTRRFAGIAKAIALRVSDGSRQLVYLTIAGTDDIPIDPTSDLYQNLLEALQRWGDADLPLRVDTRDLKALVLSANVRLLSDYRWEPVAAALRTKLLDSFGFNKRSLGQPALVCELISVMQQVEGVAYVDIDAFGAVPEQVSDVVTRSDGTVERVRLFLTPTDVAKAVLAILTPKVVAGKKAPGTSRLPANVDAWPGGNDSGVLRPAELAVFMPDVPDTLILNQIP